MRGEVELFQMAVPLKSPDWELGQQWEQQYFYKKG